VTTHLIRWYLTSHDRVRFSFPHCRMWSSDVKIQDRCSTSSSLICRPSRIYSVPTRWRWRGRERAGTSAVLLWLHYALPDSFLESPLRFRPTHRVLERLGLFYRVHFPHRRSDGCDRGPGLSFRLHRWSQRLSHRCGVCGPRHLRSRWASVVSNGSNIILFLGLLLGFVRAVEAAAWEDLCNLGLRLCCQSNSLLSFCCKQRQSLFHLFASLCCLIVFLNTARDRD